MGNQQSIWSIGTWRHKNARVEKFELIEFFSRRGIKIKKAIVSPVCEFCLALMVSLHAYKFNLKMNISGQIKLFY
jgi:hypothetical protein